MRRGLYARECGEESRRLDHIFSAPWTYLSMDGPRGYDVKYCEQARFIDIDPTSGSLILCGGSTSPAYGDPYSAAVGVFRYVEKGQRAAEQDLLSQYIHVKATPIEFTCGQWHPHSQACFVTGSNDYAEVIVWDTERFAPKTSFELDDDDAVMSAAMSHCPGAEAGLVAVGTFQCKYVRLVAMEIGTAVHTMQIPVSGIAGINDISWCPVNPYMIASVDTEGAAYLFDIRKSGISSCLLQFDESRRMPTFEESKCRRIYTSGGVVHDKSQGLFRIERPTLLGLGCAWNGVWNERLLHSFNRMSDFDENITNEDGPKAPQMGRVRFTPDGSTVMTVDVHGLIRAWDVFTGRLVRTYYNAAAADDKFDGWYQGFCTPFEVSPDGSHILCTPHKGDRRGSLLTLDPDGCEISCAEGPPASADITGMQDLILHPLHEEAYSIPCEYQGNRVTCWSSQRKDQPKKMIID